MFRTVSIAALAAVAMGAALTLRASDVVPAAAVVGVTAAGPPRVLVLHNGRTLIGAIRVTPTGFEITEAAGIVYIPTTAVWFTAYDLREAYAELSKRLPDRSAAGHTGLARWCVNHDLPTEALAELREALRIDPTHAAARQMLRTLGDLLEPEPAVGASAVPTAAVPMELPSEVAAAYVSQIQPLLMSRCGNAACHGTSSDGAFRLRNVRRDSPGFRSLTAMNLDAIAAYIDATAPQTSPLLVRSSAADHAAGRPVFVGSAGEHQRQALAAWVRQFAATRPQTASQTATSTPVAFAELVPSTATEPNSSEPTAVGTPDAAEPTADGAADLLRRVLNQERPDAFDPNAFNRRFGPRAGGSSR